MTFWTHYEPIAGPHISPPRYAAALQRLHDGMRSLDVSAPLFTERVESALRLLASTEDTPELPETERDLLDDTLRDFSGAVHDRSRAGQLLHGEPHPGNLLNTSEGLLFVDLETCCRGPVEFDLAHAPAEVGEHYPGVDHAMLLECRILVLAMIITWRWDRRDQLPRGRQLGVEWLGQLRTALERHPEREPTPPGLLR